MSPKHFLVKTLAAFLAACLASSGAFAAQASFSGAPIPSAQLPLWAGLIQSFLPQTVVSSPGFNLHPLLVQSVARQIRSQGYLEPNLDALGSNANTKAMVFETAVQNARFAMAQESLTDDPAERQHLSDLAEAQQQMLAILPGYFGRDERAETEQAITAARERSEVAVQDQEGHVKDGVHGTVQRNWEERSPGDPSGLAARVAPEPTVRGSGLLPSLSARAEGEGKAVDVSPPWVVTRRPGYDSRFKKVIARFLEKTSANPNLAHLPGALKAFLDQSEDGYRGSIGYEVLQDPQGKDVPYAWRLAAKRLQYNLNMEDANVDLQAGILAVHVQEFYDYSREPEDKRRVSISKEAAVRRNRVAQAFFQDVDLSELARSLNPNNDMERALFMEIVSMMAAATLGFHKMDADLPILGSEHMAAQYASEGATLSKTIAGHRKQLETARHHQDKLRDVTIPNREAERLLLAELERRHRNDVAKSDASHPLDTELGDPADKVAVSIDELPVVPVRRRPAEDRGIIVAALALLEEAIRGDPDPDLTYLITIKQTAIDSGKWYSALGEMVGALAYVTPLTRDFLTNVEMLSLHPAFLAAIYAQELYHIGDALGTQRFPGDQAKPRPFTMETEHGGWEAQALAYLKILKLIGKTSGDLAPQVKIVEEVRNHPRRYNLELNLQVLRMMNAITDRFDPGSKSLPTALVAYVGQIYREIFGTQILGLQSALALKQALVQDQLGTIDFELEKLQRQEDLENDAFDATSDPAHQEQLARIRAAKALWAIVQQACNDRIAQLQRAIDEAEARARGEWPPAPLDETPALARAPGWLQAIGSFMEAADYSLDEGSAHELDPILVEHLATQLIGRGFRTPESLSGIEEPDEAQRAMFRSVVQETARQLITTTNEFLAAHPAAATPQDLERLVGLEEALDQLLRFPSEILDEAEMEDADRALQAASARIRAIQRRLPQAAPQPDAAQPPAEDVQAEEPEAEPAPPPAQEASPRGFWGRLGEWLNSP